MFASVFADFLRTARALRVHHAHWSGIGVDGDDLSYDNSFGMDFAFVCAHFWREIPPGSTENRGNLRPIRCDFSAHDARIGRRACAIIVGSRCASCR